MKRQKLKIHLDVHGRNSFIYYTGDWEKLFEFFDFFVLGYFSAVFAEFVEL